MKRNLNIGEPDTAQLKAQALGLSPKKRALLERQLTLLRGDLQATARRRNKRLVAYVTSHKDNSMTSGDLRIFLKEMLPDHMVPAAFLMVDEMPLTPSGKIDRQRLLTAARLPSPVSSKDAGARTPVEEIVITLFEDVLKLDRVGTHDDFFEIGGHSLLATQVVSRVRNAFGVEIGVRSLFEETTVAGLSRKIEEVIMGVGQPPPPGRVGRDSQEDGEGLMRAPLSLRQQELWLYDQLAPNTPCYNIPGAVRLEGRLEVEILERVINEIVRRHEALRTRIEVVEGEPVQVVEEWERRKLEIADLRGIETEEREEEVGRSAAAEMMTGFNLSRGPLLRAKILKLEEELHVLLLTMSHITGDLWSMGILIREVGALYQGYIAGEEPPLPQPVIRYGDFALWQRRYLENEALGEHLQYWKNQLGGRLPIVNLTGDRPRPLVPSYRGTAKSISLPVTLCESLKVLSRRERATLFMVLLTTFKTLLYRYTTESDVVVATMEANRNRPEIENLVGCFMNALPLRTDLAGNPRFTELLKKVKEATLAAYAHRETPFERLVKEIEPERKSEQAPLFNIAVGMHNAPDEEVRLTGLKIVPMALNSEPTRFDLALWIIKDAENIRLGWVYSADLFKEETIMRMHGHFETLLSSVVAQPDAPLDELEMLTEAEQAQQSADRAIRKEQNYSRFKSMKPKAVVLSEE